MTNILTGQLIKLTQLMLRHAITTQHKNPFSTVPALSKTWSLSNAADVNNYAKTRVLTQTALHHIFFAVLDLTLALSLQQFNTHSHTQTG